jgi:hypothetical protein
MWGIPDYTSLIGAAKSLAAPTYSLPWCSYPGRCEPGCNPNASSPVATKRYLRAVLKATDLCAADPARGAQRLVDANYTPLYDYAFQTLTELPYDRWREFDPEDSMRFHALRLQEVGTHTLASSGRHGVWAVTVAASRSALQERPATFLKRKAPLLSKLIAWVRK